MSTSGRLATQSGEVFNEKHTKNILLNSVLSFFPHFAAKYEVRPWGLKWRSSVWFVTLVVGLGITTDLLVYSIVIPVLPFYLESLNYSGVSSLVGYLLFAYSGGLVVATPVIAWFSERYNLRQMPLVLGLLALTGSQIMLMLAPTYWVMALARVIQGVSSSMVWVVALALLCDTTPERYIGQQLGIAMSGLSLGLLIGLPVGGALYGRWGYYAPYYFGIVVTIIDLVGRLLVIERKDAMKWGVDPAADVLKADDEAQDTAAVGGDVETICEETPIQGPSLGGSKEELQGAREDVKTERPIATTNIPVQPSTPLGMPGPSSTRTPVADDAAPASLTSSTRRLSMLQVVALMMKSSRTLTGLLITAIYGIVYSGQEPIISLHLQAIWGLNSTKVGLVTLGGVIPTLLSSPVAGWWSDKNGPEWVTIVCLLLSLPWWGVVTINTSLALFIVGYALESMFTSAVIAPLTAELAAISRSIDGVGYAHIYGAFNLFYGIGSALGPLIGGQMYEHLSNGWFAYNMMALGLLFASALIASIYIGDNPLMGRLVKMFRGGTKTQSENSGADGVPALSDS